MSKIICDICGTSYQDTAECCPICGCSRDAASALMGEEVLLEEVEETAKGKGGLFSSKKKKEIFDYDEVNPGFEEAEEEDDDEYDEDEDEEYEDEPHHNTFVVILLTILITAMLVAAGFLFVRFILPSMTDKETAESSETTAAAQIQEAATETTELSIPCERLLLTSGTAELSAEGQLFLLHVTVKPEDTTDEVIYESADESIATVTADGRITAVAEGETIVYITCGNIQIPCPVVCKFVEETEQPTEETTSEENVAEETTAEENTTEQTKPAAASDVVLKLKKTDIMLKAPYSCQLELDCALNVEDVEWSVEHGHIATVENGYVTALKAGTTEVIAKYGDQEVRCIVRCY